MSCSGDRNSGGPETKEVVEVEFAGMRAQTNGVVLLLVVRDPYFENVLGEDIAFEEVGVTFFQVLESFEHG